MRPLRILVGIANHGTRNRAHLDRLLAEYAAMPHAVDVHVFCDEARVFPAGVSVHVGTPTRDPWSLPFAHRPLFGRRVDLHDLFVYSEDDVLIEARHIEAFMAATRVLPSDHVAAFVRYEEDGEGRRSYPDMHGPYRWDAGTATRSGDYLHARFSNDHAACYVLTQAQLRGALHSGGYAVAPHGGRYDLLCSAGTDPYTQCGMTRVVCISHLADFEVHHLPDAYVRGVGMIDQDCVVVDEAALRRQVDALADVARGEVVATQLFATEKRLPAARWDKRYHEGLDPLLVSLLPAAAADVLSVGCGSGLLEAHLAAARHRVVAMPLDAVIAAVAARVDVVLTVPDLRGAIAALATSAFDVVLLPDVLQHLEDPADALSRLRPLLREGGLVIGSVPNLAAWRRWAARLARRPGAARVGDGWARTGLHATSRDWLRRILAQAGLRLHPEPSGVGLRPWSSRIHFMASRVAR